MNLSRVVLACLIVGSLTRASFAAEGVPTAGADTHPASVMDESIINPVVVALQAAGFQALPLRLPAPAQAGMRVFGGIQTGVSGFKVVMMVFACPDAPQVVCSIGVSSTFDDAKNKVTPDLLAQANSQILFSKTLKGKKPNGAATFTVLSVVFCRGVNHAELMAKFLPVFGTEVTRVIALYNS